MNPALWGLTTALCWGGADFIARFTGRALGHRLALAGMLSVGVVVFSALVWRSGQPLNWDPGGAWLLLATGVGVMVATLLLYWGIARGPVTVVAPIVGAYPAVNVGLAVLAFGARPLAVQWLAMGGVMAGVLVVARCARQFEGEAGYDRAQLRTTVAIALGSALAFAFTVGAAQAAMQIYGELQTVWLARCISLAAILGLLAWRREAPRIGGRWLPLILIQGLLDGTAYLTLLLGSHGDGAAIVVVTASGFSAVTVVLAWLILREPMTALQWAGVILIILGVGVLSAFDY